MKQTKKNIILISVILYGVTTIISYFVFANTSFTNNLIRTPIPQPKQVGGDKDGKLVFDETLPKTEACPLNGQKYSVQQKNWWEKHRPLGVMIENSVDARPQSGLQSADVVYEAVAEGGITRFLAVFYCQDAGQIGPVRSARTYFLDYISEYGENPLYAHVGGANTPGPANALGQIIDYGWNFYNDLNQFSVPFPIFKRIENINGRPVATEHTMYSNTGALWEYAADKRKLSDKDQDGVSWDKTFIPYTFKEDVASSSRPTAQKISFEFWNGYEDFSVVWNYNSLTNHYTRQNGGKSHTDRNTKKPLSAKNVVLLFMKESNANDGYENNLHMLYGTKGTGRALVFMDGKEIEGRWKKPTRESRTVLTDSAGRPIELNRGLTWFEILATDTDVTVTP